METDELLAELKSCVAEISQLKGIKEGFHNPHVKAWKTRLGEALQVGGSTCRKSLEILNNMKITFLSGSEFIRSQTYINQLDALELNLNRTIQSIQIFGRPEDKDILPHWGKPKCQKLAVGHMLVGDEDVATDAVTIHEVLDCLVSLAEDSNHLSDHMRDTLISHLNAILKDDLLQPFMEQKMDVLLGHWPEFQSK